MPEAFRLTVEDHPDRVAVRTKDDEVSLTWAQLRDRVDALAGGLAGLGVRRGDTVALMLGNRPEFHIADLAGDDARRGAVLDLPDVHAGPDRVHRRRRGREAWRSSRSSTSSASARRAPSCRRSRRVDACVDGRARREATPSAGTRSRAPIPDFDAEPHWRAVEPGGRPDADLHLRHDRAAQGRAARAPQHHGRGQGRRRRDPVPRRLEGDLVAAGGAHRRAQRAPLPADRVRDDDHDCPNPREIVAYLPAVKPTWFFAVPRIFEKLKAGLEGASLHAGRADRRLARRGRAAQGRARAGRRAGARRRRRDRRRGRGAAVRRAARDARARRGDRASTPARRRRRATCSSSSTRSASRSASCGACRRPAGSARSTRPSASGSAPSGRRRPGVEMRLADDGELLCAATS